MRLGGFYGLTAFSLLLLDDEREVADKIAAMNADMNATILKDLSKEFLYLGYTVDNFPFMYDCAGKNDAIEVIFPAENPGMTFDTKNVFTLKKDALRKFLTQYNDVETLRCLEYSKYTLDEEDKDIIKKKARDLDTGAYAVDRNLSVNNDIESEMLYLKGF